ncbi:MAG TPA: hypothetical protein VKN99_06015 [Polyangia bacterium]|nr:hypothetical protein [Polyangia bacterium]
MPRWALLALLGCACVRPQLGPPPQVEAAALSPLGGLAAIAVVRADGLREIRLWSRWPEVPDATLPTLHRSPIDALLFSPSGALIASAGLGELLVQRASDGVIVRAEPGAPGGEGSIAFSSDAHFVVSTWADGARAFPLPTGEAVPIDQPSATRVAAALDKVAVGGPQLDKTCLYDLPSGIVQGCYQTGGARCLALEGSGRFLAAGRADGQVALLDLRAQPPAAYAGAQLAGPVDLVDFLPGPRLVAAQRPTGTDPAYVQLVRLDRGSDELARHIEVRRLFALGWRRAGLALLGERCGEDGCRLGIFGP